VLLSCELLIMKPKPVSRMERLPKSSIMFDISQRDLEQIVHKHVVRSKLPIFRDEMVECSFSACDEEGKQRFEGSCYFLSDQSFTFHEAQVIKLLRILKLN